MIAGPATALLTGAALGLSAGLSPGPLLALVIVQTLTYSVREGVKVAAAPLVTDLPIVLAALALTAGLAVCGAAGGSALRAGTRLASTPSTIVPNNQASGPANPYTTGMGAWKIASPTP